jgi:hypothetical protein
MSPEISHAAERLVSMTDLPSGERLVEEATIDGSGQLVALGCADLSGSFAR